MPALAAGSFRHACDRERGLEVPRDAVVSRSCRAVLGLAVSCLLSLIVAAPAMAVTVQGQEAEWLTMDAATLAGAQALDPFEAAGRSQSMRSRTPSTIVPMLPLTDQFGSVGPRDAANTGGLSRKARSIAADAASHAAVRQLAGGSGASSTDTRERRSAHRDRVTAHRGHAPNRSAGARARAVADDRAAQARAAKRRQHAPGPVDRLVVDMSVLFTTQFDGSRYANSNCTMAAAAMLYEVQTGRSVSGAQIRMWSRARSRGTGLLEVQRAFRAGHQPVKIYEDYPWSKFIRAVAEGRSAVVMGWYGYLPDRYVLQRGFRTAHSVFVLGYSRHVFQGNGGFYVMDPLGRNGYAGQWWTRKAMWRFAWRGKPGVRGSGPRAFRGSVAFQMNRSVKQLGRSPDRPRFRSYWATTKELMRRSERVSVIDRNNRQLGPHLGNAILRIQDKHLRMAPRRAAKWNSLRWPLAGRGRVVEGYSGGHRSITIRTRPGTRVVASAPGRVIYRTWNRSGTGDAVYVMHGDHLFSVYTNLTGITVEPGQWVNRGTMLGRAAREGKRSTARMSLGVVTARQPFALWGRTNPRYFLRALRPTQF
jgi:hypothetical protein